MRQVVLSAGVSHGETYLDLQGTPIQDGKFFVQDARGVYENGVTARRFDGDARGHHLSNADYTTPFSAADARYAHMLTVLADAFRARRSNSTAELAPH